MKTIVFSKHALDQFCARGASKEDVKLAIQVGEKVPAKKGRKAFRKNYQSSKTKGITGVFRLNS